MLALGNFDGVHLGHQAVLRLAAREAKERGTRFVAATFDPHPRSVLRPGSAPRLLSSTGLKKDLLIHHGADEVRVIRFDEELSRKSPEEFVEDVLVEELGATVVVVGENFRFGHRAAGDVGNLQRLMAERGGEARAVALRLGEDGGGINSTHIRALVSEGRVREVSELLGRPFVVRGEVVAGDYRGRTIGFPTANVVPEPEVAVPEHGVYAGFVDVGGERYAACTNVGVAPTFARGESKVEAHLLDFDGDLYGEVVDVGFVEWVRGERKFSGAEELKEQISRDVERARGILAESGPGSGRP